jgi:hypothetical protein
MKMEKSQKLGEIVDLGDVKVETLGSGQGTGESFNPNARPPMGISDKD